MTNYLSTGRNLKPKGLRVKQALQFTLILAICIWLLNQIKPTHHENKSHGQRTLSQEDKTSVLGRKGSPTWSNHKSDSGSKGARFVEENDITDGGNTENNITFVAQSDGKKVDFTVHNENGKLGTESVVDSEKAVVEDDTDEVSTETKSRSTMKHNILVNETVTGYKEMEDGEHSFQDETGIPQYVEQDYHLSISATDNQSKMSESKAIPREDVESMQEVIVTENKDDGTAEDSENDIKAKEVSNFMKIRQVKSRDFEDFQSRISKQ